MASIPDLPLDYDSYGGEYFVTIRSLETWARAVIVLKYADIEDEMADVFLIVQLWLDVYGDKFPEDNFDNATLWVAVCGWLYGYVAWLEGNR